MNKSVTSPTILVLATIPFLPTFTISIVNVAPPLLILVVVEMQIATAVKNNVKDNAVDLDSRTFVVNLWILDHARKIMSNIITMLFLVDVNNSVMVAAKAVGIGLVPLKSARLCV